MKPESRRVRAKATTREKLMGAARAMFTARGYQATTIRDLAAAFGMSTGAVFAHVPDKAALWKAAYGFPHPWRPIAEAPTKGELCLLLVDYDEATNAGAVQAAADAGYLWNDNRLEDARFARTLGHNSDGNVGDDIGQGWVFAGWCWSQDHYTEGGGTPIAFVLLDQIAAVPPGLCDEPDFPEGRMA